MQRGRHPFFGFGDPFANFGGFGQQQDLSSFFGGRDPFADPFFSRPFGGIFDSGFFGPNGHPFMGGQSFMGDQQPGFLEHHSSHAPRSRGPVIEELDSDEEKDEKEGSEERKDNPRKHGRFRKDPLVEDPDDEAEGRKSKQMQYWNGINQSNVIQPPHSGHSFTFQSSTKTCNGVNGAYYTSSSTRRSGSDGMTFEENKEANSATGQATHRVSRGIHDKGHSVTRKLKSDGMVDTLQTLHNLQEDELSGFEEKWKGNAGKYLPGWSESPNMHDVSRPGSSNQGAWELPYVERSTQPENSVPEMGPAARGPPPPQHLGRGRADVRGLSGGGASHVRSRDQGRKH